MKPGVGIVKGEFKNGIAFINTYGYRLVCGIDRSIIGSRGRECDKFPDIG